MSPGKIFYDPDHPAGFGSVAKLANASKSNMSILNDWLSGQNTYTMHKRIRKRLPRNPYTVINIDDVWDMDLADLSSFRNTMNNSNLLNVIDIISQYPWSVPLKDKTGTSITTGFKIFISR